ncbi:MAG: hypothetical protein COA99_09790 [Moraxellaceae bacterium]|nr:MAG: hypothetical protein COA99_09790 [Moraxellaceae bacterium]
MKKQILLIEDQTLVRKSLVALINTSTHYEVVHSVETTNDALEYIQHKPTLDLILCDYNLRGETALDLLQQMNTDHSIPVILLTSFFNARHLQSCIAHGARGFIFKECDMNELEEAFDIVLSGSTYFKLQDTSTHNSPLLSTSVSIRDNSANLTPTETKTLRWLATGMSNKEIAKVLGKSDQTVKAQVREVMRKLESSSRTQAVAKATKLNLI